jgi:hypothetical protein
MSYTCGMYVVQLTVWYAPAGRYLKDMNAKTSSITRARQCRDATIIAIIASRHRSHSGLLAISQDTRETIHITK